ncbi:hypothetical protein OKW11_000720 [Pseudomonas baetica]|nr:hypothetical protein [Pseudomonas baetica]
MKQRPRIYYTESQKKLMWDHWHKGDCSPASLAKILFLKDGFSNTQTRVNVALTTK